MVLSVYMDFLNLIQNFIKKICFHLCLFIGFVFPCSNTDEFKLELQKIKKEYHSLKEAIIKEASRMEQEVSKNRNTDPTESTQDSNISEILKEIEEIKEQIEEFNIKMNKTIKIRASY